MSDSVQPDQPGQFQVTPDMLVPVEIESGQQPWCDIFLADGYRLRCQINIGGVFRIEGLPQKDMGDVPVYHLKDWKLNVQAFPRKKRK